MTLGRLRAYVLLPPFALYSLVLIALYLPLRNRRPTLAGHLQMHFHRGILFCLGVRVNVEGRPAPERPLLIASNHASWLDIFILSSLMPLAFIAKSEVNGWPVVGFLARLQQSIFVDRQRRGQTGAQAEEIARRLADGATIVLFAEGTTSDGNDVLPFRSALFGAAKAAIDSGAHEAITVQPVAIAYTKLHGLPLGRQWRRLVAWTGDEDLAPHLATFLDESAFDVSVRFGAPIPFTADGDRKRVSERAEAEVRGLLADALRGG